LSFDIRYSNKLNICGGSLYERKFNKRDEYCLICIGNYY